MIPENFNFMEDEAPEFPDKEPADTEEMDALNEFPLHLVDVVDENGSYKEIFNQICTLVANGTLKPGQQLPGERVLAERFGVGRASIRTALKFLEFIGLVNSRVGKGVFVSSNSRDLAAHYLIDVLDSMRNDPFRNLFEARLAVETAMTELAARNAQPENLELMKQSLLKQRERVQTGRQDVKDIDDFHELIYKASKNMVMHRICIMLSLLMHESRKITQAIPGRAERSLKEHEAIYEAIASKNAPLAAKLMRSHLNEIAKERFPDWELHSDD